MAKLSARGRTAVVEAVREYTAEQLQKAHDRYTASYKTETEPSLTVWERKTRRLMSDGTVLEKQDVIFRPGPYDSQPQRHSYGWKVHGKLKAGLTPADYARVYEAPRKDGSPSEWTVTTSGIAKTVILSPARILRAAQSGESIGFCQACGADQHGCEPDARGYTCESCGKPEVYGAEELAMNL